jgi:hypothetical protein
MEQQHILNWSKLIIFNIENVGKIQNLPAVFRLSKKLTDGKFYVFFVGSTAILKDDLLKLLSENNDDISLKSYLADGEISFRYALVEDENMRVAIEKQMYKHYAPQFNIKEPSSSLDLKVNLN